MKDLQGKLVVVAMTAIGVGLGMWGYTYLTTPAPVVPAEFRGSAPKKRR
jgi:hypothetical protein|tara:strand:+ start:4626 stop:4772 length:147 start_codon:yes stop_codon:yes gene_type:complete